MGMSIILYFKIKFCNSNLICLKNILNLCSGMFDTSPPDQSGSNTGLSEKQEKKQLRQTKNYPTGIYGIGVRQNSSERQDTGSSGDEAEDLDDVSWLIVYKVIFTHFILSAGAGDRVLEITGI